MRVTHCYVCNRPSGFARRLGWGTFFMAVLTAGLWLLTIPFYPKRCVTCGCTEAGAARAALVSEPPTHERQLMAAYGMVAAVVLVAFILWIASRSQSASSPASQATPTENVGSQPTAPTVSRKPSRKSQMLYVAVTESTSTQADASGHVLYFSSGHLTAPGVVTSSERAQLERLQSTSKIALMCDDAQPTCMPLRPGQTYQMQTIRPGEPDYAYGYVKGTGSDVVRIYGQAPPQYGGKTANVVYVLSAAQN